VCAHISKKFPLRSLQAADWCEFIKNELCMGSVCQLIGQVLTGPMLVMFAVSPQPRASYIVDNAAQRDPDFRPVLTISQGQLGLGIFSEGAGHAGRAVR
jgi:hypothetical protein